jgi:hypothetical protein
MPMPNPEGKSESEFMQECVSFAVNEGMGKEQAVAACQVKFKEKPAQSKSKIEILNSIKRLIEKNGYTISDEKIIEMFGVFNTKENSKILTLNTKLEAGKKQTIKVFPKKTVYIEKYDVFQEFNDILFDRMIENFGNPKLFKPYMDVEHQLGEKYADITNLFKKEDGLYAEIELNEAGLKAIKEKQYSYISPEWGDRKDTENIKHSDVLWAVTLTNIPALEGELPMLQEQIKLEKGGKIMDLNKRLAKLEGKVENLKLQEEPMLSPEILEALQMIKEAVAKIDELTQAKDIAEEEAAKFKKQVEETELSAAKEEKESFFKEVVENGRLEADEVDEWSKQYDLSEESKQFVKRMLLSRPEKKSFQLSTSFESKHDKLSKDDYRIGEEAGYDMDDAKERKRYMKEVLNDLKIHKSSMEV